MVLLCATSPSSADLPVFFISGSYDRRNAGDAEVAQRNQKMREKES